MRSYAPLFAAINKPLPQLTFLAGDASFRTYYRFHQEDHTYVLMDAPEPENPEQFCHVAKLLNELGYSAPHIIASDFSQGYVVVEDLGDFTFARCLNEGGDPILLYERALDLLIDLHQRSLSRPDYIPFCHPETLVKAVDIFLEWYWPYHRKDSPSSSDREAFHLFWQGAYGQALESPHHLVLRDYHVDNLVWLSERQGLRQCGLLDFQDAVWGPQIYDVISLLEDARRDVSEDLYAHLWQRYLQAFPEPIDELIRAGVILAAGRHMRVLGVFARKWLRDGKDAYLQHIPRLWRLLRRSLSHPELSVLKSWLETHFDSH